MLKDNNQSFLFKKKKQLELKLSRFLLIVNIIIRNSKLWGIVNRFGYSTTIS